MTNREEMQSKYQETVDKLVADAVAAQSVRMVEYKAMLEMQTEKVRARMAKALTVVTQTLIMLLMGGIGMLGVWGIWWVILQIKLMVWPG